MENIRKFSRSWKGRVAMGFILAPMAFLGMNQPSSGPQGNIVATVGNAELSELQLDKEISNQRSRLLANGVSSQEVDETVLRDSSLKALINQTLLSQQARKLGIAISDRSITQLLKSYPVFLDETGKFSNERFAQVMRSNRLSKEDIFNNERNRLSVEQVTEGIISTAIYPMSEIDKIIDLELETRNVWLYRVPWQDFSADVKITDAEIKSYYDEHAQTFLSIPQVDLSILKMEESLIKVDDNTVTEEEINEQYNAYLLENNYQDMRDFSQILLTGDDAEAVANDIVTKIDAGTEFSALAKEFSDDESGKNGGMIGKVDTSMYGADAENVDKGLKDLAINDVSKPIKTAFGYQIFKVTADASNEVPTLDSIRDEILEKAVTYKRSVLFADKITKINEMAGSGFAIADIAKETGLTIEKIDNYKQYDNVSDLSQPVVIKAAFNELSIQNKTVSTGIDIDNAVVWMQSENHRPKKQLTFEESKVDVKAIIEQQQAINLAVVHLNQQAQDSNITKKDAINKLKSSMEFVEFKNTNRSNPQLTKNEQTTAFSKRNIDTEVVSMVTATENGATFIIADEIISEVSEHLPQEQKRQLANQIRSNFGQINLSDYVDYLNTSVDIKINDRDE